MQEQQFEQKTYSNTIGRRIKIWAQLLEIKNTIYLNNQENDLQEYDLEENDPKIAVQDLQYRLQKFKNSGTLSGIEAKIAEGVQEQYEFFNKIKSMQDFENLLNSKTITCIPIEFINDHATTIMFSADQSRSYTIDHKTIGNAYGNTGINMIEGYENVNQIKKSLKQCFTQNDKESYKKQYKYDLDNNLYKDLTVDELKNIEEQNEKFDHRSNEHGKYDLPLYVEYKIFYHQMPPKECFKNIIFYPQQSINNCAVISNKLALQVYTIESELESLNKTWSNCNSEEKEKIISTSDIFQKKWELFIRKSVIEEIIEFDQNLSDDNSEKAILPHIFARLLVQQPDLFAEAMKYIPSDLHNNIISRIKSCPYLEDASEILDSIIQPLKEESQNDEELSYKLKNLDINTLLSLIHNNKALLTRYYEIQNPGEKIEELKAIISLFKDPIGNFQTELFEQLKNEEVTAYAGDSIQSLDANDIKELKKHLGSDRNYYDALVDKTIKPSIQIILKAILLQKIITVMSFNDFIQDLKQEDNKHTISDQHRHEIIALAVEGFHNLKTNKECLEEDDITDIMERYYGVTERDATFYTLKNLYETHIKLEDFKSWPETAASILDMDLSIINALNQTFEFTELSDRDRIDLLSQIKKGTDNISPKINVKKYIESLDPSDAKELLFLINVSEINISDIISKIDILNSDKSYKDIHKLYANSYLKDKLFILETIVLLEKDPQLKNLILKKLDEIALSSKILNIDQFTTVIKNAKFAIQQPKFRQIIDEKPYNSKLQEAKGPTEEKFVSQVQSAKKALNQELC